MRDLLDRRPASLVSPAMMGPSPAGLGLLCSGVNDGASAAPLNITGPITVESLAYPSSLRVGHNIVLRLGDAGSFLSILTNYLSFSLTGVGGIQTITSGPEIVAGKPYHLSGTWGGGGTSVRAYVNGRGATGPTGAGPGVTSGTTYFGNYGGSNIGLAGAVLKASAYSRALTPDEVRWLAAEPYAMIRPAGPMRRYFTVTALDQVFRLREQPQRFRMTELPPRFALTEQPQRFRLTEKRP